MLSSDSAEQSAFAHFLLACPDFLVEFSASAGSSGEQNGPKGLPVHAVCVVHLLRQPLQIALAILSRF